MFLFFLFASLNFILLQKVSLHLEKQGSTNFSYWWLEGRTCLILPKRLHSTNLQTCILNECKVSK